MYVADTVTCDHAEHLETVAKPRGRSIKTSTLEQIEHMGAVTNTTGVADVLGCTVQYARRLCENGTLEAVKMGNNWRVKTSSLLKFAGLA